MHVFDGLKEPELLVEKLTVLVGDDGVDDVSVTVAVQEVAWVTTTLDRLQVTLVEVVANEAKVTGAKYTAFVNVLLVLESPPAQYTKLMSTLIVQDCEAIPTG